MDAGRRAAVVVISVAPSANISVITYALELVYPVNTASSKQEIRKLLSAKKKMEKCQYIEYVVNVHRGVHNR